MSFSCCMARKKELTQSIQSIQSTQSTQSIQPIQPIQSTQSTQSIRSSIRSIQYETLPVATGWGDDLPNTGSVVSTPTGSGNGGGVVGRSGSEGSVSLLRCEMSSNRASTCNLCLLCVIVIHVGGTRCVLVVFSLCSRCVLVVLLPVPIKL